MARITVKRFASPDEVRPFQAHGRAEVLKTERGPVVRAIFEPGWRWSVDVRPIANTGTCEASHSGYVLAGRMRVVMDDGEEAEMAAGDFFQIPPGHDAWVVGNEACVLFDFGDVAQYARRSEESAADDMRSSAAMHFSEGA